MHNILKRFSALAILACFPLLLAACGGGGGGGNGAPAPMTTISGTATKGPIKGAKVEVYTLRTDGTAGEYLGTGVTLADGTYSIQVPADKAFPPLMVTVSGGAGATYFSETKGTDVDMTTGDTFRAVLDTYDPAKSYAVTPLTEAGYQQLQKVLTQAPTAVAGAKLISAANARIGQLFGLSDILANPAGDPAYSATLKVIDQMVETSKSSGATSTLPTMNLMNQGFVDVSKPEYQAFRTMFTQAVTTAGLQNSATVQAILATLANPPAEPIYTDSTPPAAVTKLVATAAADSSASAAVTLSWNAATTAGKNPVSGYEVYRDGKKIATVTTTGYTDKGLSYSTQYSYYIIAFDAAANRSAASDQVSVTTPAAPNLTITVGGQLTSDVTSLPAKPLAPTGLSATTSAINTTTSSVSLTWTAPTGTAVVTGYDVYRDDVKIGTATTTAYTDTPVISGITYVYKLIAFDAAGNRSVASATFSVTPAPPNLNITVGGQVPAN